MRQIKEMTEMTKLTVDRAVLMFAFEYAIKRESYAPNVVIDNIKANLSSLTVEEIETYVDKITEYLPDLEGISKLMWIDLQSYLTIELEAR